MTVASSFCGAYHSSKETLQQGRDAKRERREGRMKGEFVIEIRYPKSALYALNRDLLPLQAGDNNVAHVWYYSSPPLISLPRGCVHCRQ